MNTFTSRRGPSPHRAPKGRRQNKKNLLNAVAARRLQKLEAAYLLHRTKGGAPLNFTRLSQRMGRSAGTASQYFNGYSPLNIEWMLGYARELDMSPQEIFTDDWPFPEMTVSPTFSRMMNQWSALAPQKQASILKMLDGEYLGPRGGRPKRR